MMTEGARKWFREVLSPSILIGSLAVGLLLMILDHACDESSEYERKAATARPDLDIEIDPKLILLPNETIKDSIMIYKDSIKHNFKFPLVFRVQTRLTNKSNAKAIILGRACACTTDSLFDVRKAVFTGHDSILWLEKDWGRTTYFDKLDLFIEETKILIDTIYIQSTSLPATVFIHYIVWYQNEFGVLWDSYLPERFIVTPIQLSIIHRSKLSDSLEIEARIGEAKFDLCRPEVNIRSSMFYNFKQKKRLEECMREILQ